MTQRELFVAAALTGFCANSNTGSDAAEDIAQWSLDAADATVDLMRGTKFDDEAVPVIKKI